MNNFIEGVQLLETGIENVSPHLRWLLRNAILEHCGMNAVDMIAYHKNIPTDNWGEAITMCKAIALNLEKHYNEAFEEVLAQNQKNVSIRFFLIHNLLDTAIHEAHHLKAAFEQKVYEDQDIEQDEAVKIANKKSWTTAKLFDVEIFTFGPVLDKLLEDIIEAFREDITPAEGVTETIVDEWKALQVFMWDNKLAFYDPETEQRIGMRSMFEAQSEELPWTDPPIMFTGETKLIIPQQETTTAATTQPAEPIQPVQPVQPEQPVQTGPSLYSGEDELSTVDYSSISYTNPTTATVQTSIPNTAAPITGQLSNEEIRSTAEQVFRTLFWHVASKCEFNIEGGWNNPHAIFEPVNITHIPHASQLFTNMNTVDEYGVQLNGAPCNGFIKGKLSKTLQLPMYELFLNMNGTLHKRTLLVQNPNKKKGTTGEYTAWAAKARSGHIIMMLLEDKKPTDPPEKNNLRAHITLNPGAHLGQEVYELVSK